MYKAGAKVMQATAAITATLIAAATLAPGVQDALGITGPLIVAAGVPGAMVDRFFNYLERVLK